MDAGNAGQLIYTPRMERATRLAREAHASIGQKRKYSGEPYDVHTHEVANVYAEYYPGDEEGFIAAEFHDLLEDVTPKNPFYSEEWLRNEFGSNVLSLVQELTDKYTSEAFPEMRRASRKALERLRLSGVSPTAQTIKLADLLSNTSDIVKNDEGFAKVYLREKLELLPLLRKGNDHLYLRVYYQLFSILNEKKWEIRIKERSVPVAEVHREGTPPAEQTGSVGTIP